MSESKKLGRAYGQYIESSELQDLIGEQGEASAKIVLSAFSAGWMACLASRLEGGRPDNGKADMQA